MGILNRAFFKISLVVTLVFHVFWTIFKPIVGKDSVTYLVLNKSVAIAHCIGCQIPHVGQSSVLLLICWLTISFENIVVHCIYFVKI